MTSAVVSKWMAGAKADAALGAARNLVKAYRCGGGAGGVLAYRCGGEGRGAGLQV